MDVLTNCFCFRGSIWHRFTRNRYNGLINRNLFIEIERIIQMVTRINSSLYRCPLKPMIILRHSVPTTVAAFSVPSYPGEGKGNRQYPMMMMMIWTRNCVTFHPASPWLLRDQTAKERAAKGCHRLHHCRLRRKHRTHPEERALWGAESQPLTSLRVERSWR